jgi:nicotinamidase/pyrazinamidase
MKKGILFWDVDTQYDFMRPEGRLYVPGAEGIIDTVDKVRHFALDNGFSMLADMDWHKDGNPEISDTQFQDTFPPHCRPINQAAKDISRQSANRRYPDNHSAMPPLS